MSEFDIKGIHLVSEDKNAEPILLRGRIDKIEILKHGVNVVDYKTGKPKSRNALMGETQASNGNEYRQLLFYKILLDRYKNGMYKVVSGEIDFVEPAYRPGRPTPSGTHKSEKFDIPDDAVSALESQIIKVATEIWTSHYYMP